MIGQPKPKLKPFGEAVLQDQIPVDVATAVISVLWPEDVPDAIQAIPMLICVADWLKAATAEARFEKLRDVWKTKAWSSSGISRKEQYVRALLEHVWDDRRARRIRTEMTRSVRRLLRRLRRSFWATIFVLFGPPLLLADASAWIADMASVTQRWWLPIACLATGFTTFAVLLVFSCPDMFAAALQAWTLDPIPNIRLVSFRIQLDFAIVPLCFGLLQACAALLTIFVLMMLKLAAAFSIMLLVSPLATTAWTMVWLCVYLARVGDCRPLDRRSQADLPAGVS